MAEYHNQSKLRFWCQMVLPLVYDDSLSYMELLNKVVSYLNNCIQDVGNCETNIESLLEAFVNLQDYVNEITEDISPLIEEKIDEMIESGEFGEILADALATVVSPEYDSSKSYIPLNYAIKDGQLYCCTANTTGEWDSTKWRETTVGDELNTLMQKVYSLNAGDVSFDPTATYASSTVGNKLKNLTANDVEYNSSQTYNNATVGKELSNLNGAISDNQIINAKWVLDLPDNTDLDTLYVNGWYTTGNSRTYINTPVPNDTYGQRIIVVFAYNNETATSYRHQFYANRTLGIYGHRVYASGRWSAWNTYGTNLLSESFTPLVCSRPADYTTGKIVKVGSYNVANYKNDTSTYIENPQILEFRKFISETKLDFLLTQEDRQYIDATSTNSSNDFLYYPLLRERPVNGARNSIVRSHQVYDTGTDGRVVFNNVPLDTPSRSIAYGVYSIGSYKLLMVDTHCIWKDADDDPESATSIAARKVNYDELFAWINGTITLRKYGNGTAVSAPNHTHAIVCMDANCATDTDKANLASAALTNNFELCNGGRFGWFKTCFDRNGSYALDEIAVSSNCIIVDVTARIDLYKKLYSDHVPVIAEVSLMPS